jgi:hypothetical protein
MARSSDNHPHYLQCLHRIPDEAGWKETLKQEFYAHWIEFIESKHPDLRGQPFETYQFNRERLSELIRKHRKVVVDKILNRIDQSVIRPDIALKINNAQDILHINNT